MKSKHGPVWVIAEQIECRILNVSFQLIGKARQLAQKLGTNVEVLLLGNQIDSRFAQLFAAGADRVYLGNHTDLAYYEPEIFSEIIVELSRKHQPDIILIGSSHMGRELAPLVAARLETGLTAHCIDVSLDDDFLLEAKVPAYGGLISIVCPEKRPQMVTIANGIFPIPELDLSRIGEIIPLKMPNNLFDRIKTIEVIRQPPEGVDLESAAIVVAGGVGACDPQGWNIIADLAVVLNAGLGCTRPVVDEGWFDLDNMIGQSGKVVAPECYIGIGLSGEQQHMVGVVGTRLSAAINNDPKSPIFELVDYGIVDDCKKFVPVLIQKIREYRENLVTC
jgi:electron transfer flavoprotein alpha subunit